MSHISVTTIFLPALVSTITGFIGIVLNGLRQKRQEWRVYARWARSSDAAYRSGRFIRTSAEPFEIPVGAVAAQEPPFETDGVAVEHWAGIWFDEPVEETSIFSEVYDESVLSLLHFNSLVGAWQDKRYRQGRSD